MTSESDAVTTEDPIAPAGAGPASEGDLHGSLSATDAESAGKRRRPQALTVVSVLALVLFALWGIGTPLVGASTLTATNEMVGQSPYSDSGFAGSVATNSFMDDTYTSGLPAQILFKATGAQWDPYTNGGVALNAVPDYAFLSPLTVPYYVLPTWLAPAYERLLEIVVAAGGMFLFLRRLKISRAASVTGGMVFATSGFMVVWLDFPQTRVAAFVPVLFWTLERYLQERRLRDAALIAVPVASMLLGGFPAVTGFALLTAAVYGLVRLVAQHRAELRKAVWPAVCAALGAGAGVGLSLFQLLPFAAFLKTWYTDGRAQNSGQHLDPVSLLTTVSPYAFGTVNALHPPLFYLTVNLIESMGYISAGAAVLVLVAFALQRSGRSLLPRGVFVFLAAAALVWAELIYLGGPPLGALQKTPVLRALFAQNFIGRSRSVLGFLLAALAAVGFELLLRHRAARSAARSRTRTLWAVGVGAVAAAVAADLLYLGERDSKTGQKQLKLLHEAGNAVSTYRHQIFYSALLVLAAIVCVVLLRISASRQDRDGGRLWRAARLSAAAALPLLISVQSALFVAAYYPHSPKNTFYPVTDTHTFLAANLGGERYASSGDGMVFGTNVAYQLRSVNGHAFTDTAFAALIQGIPGDPMPVAPYISFAASQEVATSPVLDALGTKYFVTAMSDPVFGTESSQPSDGSTLLLQPGRPVTVTVPGTGPLRGVGVRIAGPVPKAVAADNANSWITVAVKDAAGHQIAESKRLTALVGRGTFTVPVAADSVPAGTRLTATITLHATAALTIAAQNGGASPALTAVAGADDGLRLVHVGVNAIYQRLNADPRIRWASASQVVTSQADRVSMIAAGKVGGGDVLLSAAGPAATGKSADVAVTDDGMDSITTTVDAQGSGYLVVADADQVGWTATVDGAKTPLVAADQGLVAVNVPAGRHTVELTFAAPHGKLGLAAAVASAVGLIAVVLGEFWWIRTRKRSAARSSS
jgi:hypothetical protein